MNSKTWYKNPWAWWTEAVGGWDKQRQALPKPLALTRGSLSFYKRNFKLITSVIAIISIPVALISNYLIDPSSDSTLSAYLTFMQLAMNTALTYTVVKLVNRHKVGVREAYYQGSAMIVRLVLVSGLLALMALPLVLGVVILGYGVLVPGVALSIAEKLLMVLLAAIVAVPGLVLLARGVWGAYVIFETDYGPIDAIRVSRKLTKGRVIITLGRLLALLVVMLLIAIIPVGILALLASFTKISFFLVLLQVVLALLILPLSNLYLYHYYQGLKV